MRRFWENMYSQPRWQKTVVIGVAGAMVITAYALMFGVLAAIVLIWWKEIVQAVAIAIGVAALVHVFFGRR
jgi:hypothetical protein